MGEMRSLSQFLFVILVCLPAFSGNLFAQRGYTARTVEYLTATSDLVVTAVIADLDCQKNAPDVDKSGLENLELVTILLNVRRCLKGQTDDSVKLKVELPIQNNNLAKWQESEVELFWFLNCNDPDENGIVKIVPHRELRFFAAVVEPPDPDSERPPTMLLNVDFEPLKSVDVIEKTIIEFHRRFGSEKIGGTKIPVAKEIAARTGMYGDANGVLVPSNYQQLQSK